MHDAWKKAIESAIEKAKKRGDDSFTKEISQLSFEQRILLGKLNDVIELGAIKEFEELEQSLLEKEAEFYREFEGHCGELKGAIKEHKVKGDKKGKEAIEKLKQDMLKHKEQTREIDERLKDMGLVINNKAFDSLLGKDFFELNAEVQQFSHATNIFCLQGSLKNYKASITKFKRRKLKRLIAKFWFRVLCGLLLLTFFFGWLISKITLWYLVLVATILLWLFQEFIYPRWQEKSLVTMRQGQLREFINDFYMLRLYFLLQKSNDLYLLRKLDSDK